MALEEAALHAPDVHPIERSGYVRRTEDPTSWMFVWDCVADRITWPGSENGRILGHRTADIDCMAAWLAIVHPDDRSGLLESIQRDRIGAPSFRDGYRLLDAGGRAVAVVGEGVMLRDPHHQLTSIIGSVRTGTRSAGESIENGWHATLLQHLAESVVVLDDDGRIVFANRATETMFGYAPGELLGCDSRSLLAEPPERRDEILRDMRAECERTGRWTGEIDSRRRDGGHFVSRALITSFSEGPHRRWVVLRHDISDRKLVESAVFLRLRDEQSRIASELHDGLGQELSGLMLLLGRLQSQLAAEASPSASALPEIVDTAKHATALCRSMAEELAASGVGRGGLAAALAGLKARLERLHPVAVVVDVAQIDVGTLTEFKLHQLYRIAQEAARNAARHGGATTVRIRVRREGGLLLLEVEDDGHGFDPATTRPGSLGLDIMRYRASQIGASLAIKPSPTGTHVRCSLAA